MADIQKKEGNTNFSYFSEGAVGCESRSTLNSAELQYKCCSAEKRHILRSFNTRSGIMTQTQINDMKKANSERSQTAKVVQKGKRTSQNVLHKHLRKRGKRKVQLVSNYLCFVSL